MSTYRHKNEQGGISGSLIAIIGLVVLVLVAGSAAIWAYTSYRDQKTDVDGKIALAQAEAKKDQADVDEQKFAEREKEPNRQFVGPENLGRLTFSYPKTWSAYVADDGAEGSTYHAYLNPVVVTPVTEKQQYALRITIEQKDYDQVVKTYQEKVKKGDLRSSATSANGHNGTRLDGTFSKDIRGAAVIYQIRDKTVTLRTDADTFKPDFEALIKTLDFNQ
ncbi:MAG TPA: hypothetical protein VL481_03865 [Verrucomicrobiae bacterium]|nr:hypothetical protein [Verrucomicrobiae bacterium]